jgi:hypothetical protein
VPVAVPRQDLLSIPCSIDAIVNATWSIYRDNLWTCTWLCWTVGLSSIGLYLLQRAIQAQIMSLGLVSIGLAVASVVFQTWLQIGLKLGLLLVARRQPVSAGVLASGGPFLLPTIMAWIVFVVMLIPAVLLPIFATSLVVAVVGNPAAAFFSIFIVTCVSLPIVVLYASARFMQYSYLIMDRRGGAKDSLGLSWQLTRGRAGTIILVYLTYIALICGGLLTCCVGLVFTLPMAQLLLVVTYLSLVGPPRQPQQMPLLADRPLLSTWEEDL